jgi:hypothetical protein
MSHVQKVMTQPIVRISYDQLRCRTDGSVINGFAFSLRICRTSSSVTSPRFVFCLVTTTNDIYTKDSTAEFWQFCGLKDRSPLFRSLMCRSVAYCRKLEFKFGYSRPQTPEWRELFSDLMSTFRFSVSDLYVICRELTYALC